MNWHIEDCSKKNATFRRIMATFCASSDSFLRHQFIEVAFPCSLGWVMILPTALYRELHTAQQLPDVNLCTFPCVGAVSILYFVEIVCFLICPRLRKEEQRESIITVDTGASFQTQGKLQDGCNNNVLRHTCTRGCCS